jgi:hypothetical protein
MTVTRALAYCVFQENKDVNLPATGVQGAAVREITEGSLRVLWSEVDWPFQPAEIQKNAVEFHQVINYVFARTAVAPFRLLTVFENRQTLEQFVAARAQQLSCDLERLHDFVQMECVLYLIAERAEAGDALSSASVERKADLLRTIERSALEVKDALAGTSPEVRIRPVKSGSRLFALVRRGAEAQFSAIAESASLPEGVSRRTSGPRPAAEFLSEALKA